MGGSKGKAGMQLKYIPGKRDTTEMYPVKVMRMIGGQTFDPKVLLFQLTMHCHSHLLGFIYKVLPEYGR